MQDGSNHRCKLPTLYVRGHSNNTLHFRGEGGGLQKCHMTILIGNSTSKGW